MIDPTKPYSDAAEWQDIQRRVTALERAARKPANGADGDYVGGLALCTSSTYADLPGGVGPTASVYVPPSGRVYVIATTAASVFLPGGLGVNQGTAFMAVALSGANTATPVVGTDDSAAGVFRDDSTPEARLEQTIVYMRLVENLTPGLTTFTCQYARTSDEILAVQVNFAHRGLVVIPL